MKKFRKIILMVSVIGMGWTFQSCNFLNVDKYFLDTLNEDSIFATSMRAEGYLWNTATMFPDPGNIWGSSYCPGELASDEMVARWNTSEFPGIKFTIGEVNSTNVSSYSFDIWKGMYKIIARTNEMMSKVDLVADMSTIQRNSYRGYCHFMRGLAYYYLLQNYGPILNVGEDIMDNNETAEYYNRERSTYDESIEYICGEFEKAAKTLPGSVSRTLYTRPTKGAAFSIIARLRLQHASPMFNGGGGATGIGIKYFADWKRKSDGANYIQQNYDPKRWAVAAAAAKRVIDLPAGEGYKIYTVEKSALTAPLPDNVPSANFPDGAGGIDHFHSYKDMFTGEAMPQFIPEFIWCHSAYSGSVRMYIRHSFSRNYEGWGGMSVPQRVIDCYHMANGMTIEEAAKIQIDDLANPKPQDKFKYFQDGDDGLLVLSNESKVVPKNFNDPERLAFSGYEIKKLHVPAMYVNREMRFYASIGFSGAFWTMSSATASTCNNKQLIYAADQKLDGKAAAGANVYDYTCTAYVPTKYIHADDAFKDDNKQNNVLNKSFPFMRYAEILMIYAEALNNIEGSVTIQAPDYYGEMQSQTFTRNTDEIAKYFNQIRFRAGLPGATAEQLATRQSMFKVIQRELQVEFFNENRRFYDVRRWGIYPESDFDWKGLNVEGTLDKSNKNQNPFYKIVDIDEQVIRDRVRNIRNVWLPIPNSEILKVPKMSQNPGWEL